MVCVLQCDAGHGAVLPLSLCPPVLVTAESTLIYNGDKKTTIRPIYETPALRSLTCIVFILIQTLPVRKDKKKSAQVFETD